MTKQTLSPESRARLLAAGLGGEDMAWLDALDWNDAAAPPARSEAEVEAYKRRERILNTAISALSFAERADSPEGRMAAALGAHAANWADREDDE